MSPRQRLLALILLGSVLISVSIWGGFHTVRPSTEQASRQIADKKTDATVNAADVAKNETNSQHKTATSSPPPSRQSELREQGVSSLTTEVPKTARLLAQAREAETLGKSNEPNACAKLEKMLAEEDDYVKQYALSAIVKLKGKGALPAVIWAAKSDYAAVRLRAAYEMGQIGQPESIPVLGDLSKKKDPILSIACVQALAKIQDKRVLPAIMRTLADDDARVRGTAQKVLTALTGKSFTYRQTQKQGSVSMERVPDSEERSLWDKWWVDNETSLQWDSSKKMWEGGVARRAATDIDLSPKTGPGRM